MNSPRPKRRLRRLVFPAGLAISIISLAAWTTSMWVVGYRSFASNGALTGDLTVAFDRGEFVASNGTMYWGPGWDSLRPLSNPFPLTRLNWWPYNGSILSIDRYGWHLQLPLWMPALLGLVMAVVGRSGWWRNREERRRRKRGLCEACGYDLLGSAGVCPECGKAGGPRDSRATG